MQNAFVESFNGRLRDECLNEHIFGNLVEARKIIETGALITTQNDHTHRLADCRRPSPPISTVPTPPASLELREGSAQQALTGTQSTERNRNGIYT